MRFLRRNSTGRFVLTKDFSEGDIPRYAILSHTWGPQEVTFADLENGIDPDVLESGIGREHSGFKKILFCGERAERDRLQYFWVDTCCIDKKNSTELQEAINSMFRWYQNATKCYAYLSDVSALGLDAAPDAGRRSWEPDVQNSKWFTRGWTLQELLAPSTVDFFSKEGHYLGNKSTLGRQICGITGIPMNALQGSPLSGFSIPERLKWQDSRETTRPEDKAYSLLGICGVNMPLIYGEGQDGAYKRLKREIELATKGSINEDFSVAFSLSHASVIQHFVAREEEIKEMHTALSSDGSRRAVILYGLGGMGKTQLAIEYAKRYKDSYSAIFWLNIKDEDSVKQSFTDIAKRIHKQPSFSWPRSVDMANVDEVVDSVKVWLSLANNTRWLMIFDNYDNPALPDEQDLNAVDINKFLPVSHCGSVLVTTRDSRVDFGHCIKISKLKSAKDCLKVLANSARRAGLENDPDAVELAKKLDGLPLALATAGSYLHQVSTSFAEYRRLYDASWAKLQKTSPRLTAYHKTLYSTWQISFDRVEKRSKLSAELLRLWAFLDNQDVWFELLQHCDPGDPEWIRELTQDKLNFNNAVRVLCDHGLVEADFSHHDQNKSGLPDQVESRGYNMHGCVHSWAAEVLNQECHDHLGELALKLITSHVPSWQAPQKWQIERRLMQHAVRCVDFISNGLVTEDGKEGELQRLGVLFHAQNKLEEANTFLQRSLEGFLKANIPGDARIPETLNILGLVHLEQGDEQQAEQMFHWAISGYDQAQGPDDVSKLCPMINVGVIYMQQERLDDATKLFNFIRRRYDEAYGPHNSYSSMANDNLGIIYKRKGEYEEAEKMLLLALQGYERSFGTDNESTIRTMSYLGSLYLKQDKFEDAERIFQKAVYGYERVFGLEHISTINVIDSLGIAFACQNKMDEAEERYQQAVEGFKEALGPDHLSTLHSTYRLGLVYEDQNRLNEAEMMLQEAWQGFEKKLGPDAKATLNSIDELGIVNEKLGKVDAAVTLFERARHGYEMVIKRCEANRCLECDSMQNALPKLEQIYSRRLEYFRRNYKQNKQEVVLKHCKEPISALISLCENYGKIWPTYFDILGRAFVWLGYSQEASCAFRYHSHLISDPEDLNAFCDHCAKSITSNMDRLVCELCGDVDLCRGCYTEYEINGFPSGELKERCRDHSFITIPARDTLPSSGDSSLDSFLKLWLTSIQIWWQTVGEER